MSDFKPIMTKKRLTKKKLREKKAKGYQEFKVVKHSDVNI